MEHTAPRHLRSSGRNVPTSEKPIEECWRVIAGPDALVTICAVYQRINGGLQLGILRKHGPVVRIADVVNMEAARSMATQWLMTARRNGRFDGRFDES